MSNTLYAVYGASGCGRGIMPVARAQLTRQGLDTAALYFIDDSVDRTEINGQKVLTPEAFHAKQAAHRHVVFAVAAPEIRRMLVKREVKRGVTPWTVTADNSVIMDDVIIGPGAALSPFVTLTSNIRIGSHFHANLYSYVEHDCVIGDYVTFAPGVQCNGNVTIEDYAYIGAGATIKQGQPSNPMIIGRGAVVGMGAVVTRSVPAGTTVIGNPARAIRAIEATR